MKKTPKVVAHLVTFPDGNNGDLFVVSVNRGVMEADITEAVGRIPKKPYRVTYRLNKRGAYVVEGSKYHKWITNRAGGKGSVCFLPASWLGLRVSRTVEVKK